MKGDYKICLIYNYAQHYRKGIFTLLDKELDIDFYFGDSMKGVKEMDINSLSGFRRKLTNIKIVGPVKYQKNAIRLLFKDYERYIILGEYLNLSTWVILILNQFMNKKIYLWSHGWYGNEGILKRKIKKLLFRLADGTFLYGNRAKELMINEGISEEKLYVIHNSLDYQTHILLRSKIENKSINPYDRIFKNKYPVILFIGRLDFRKKVDKLIECVLELNRVGIYSNVFIIGEGEQKSNLESFIDENGLQKIIKLYGACYNEEINSKFIYYATALASPGHVGLAAIHSITFGTPVITHDNFSKQAPEFEIIEEGKTGAFFAYNDFESLKETLSEWLVKSKENRETIRNNCYNIVAEKYTPSAQLKVIKNVMFND